MPAPYLHPSPWVKRHFVVFEAAYEIRVKPVQVLADYRDHFWRQSASDGGSHAHGHGHLEHFFDLVFVVLIAEASHHLVEHQTWRAVGEFSVVFGWVWMLWLNGALSHEINSRDDGRSRVSQFLQMLGLIVLAVFTEKAAGDDSAQFAFIAALILGYLSIVWGVVAREASDAAHEVLGRRWRVAAMLTGIVMLGLAFLGTEQVRLWTWAAMLVVWLLGGLFFRGDNRGSAAIDRRVAGRMVERFGLLTIVVLGETVFSVVGGFSESGGASVTLLTGLLGLAVGFAFWWNFFDFVGKREPNPGREGLWILMHLPIAGGMAAAASATVTLTSQASAETAPVSSAWMMAGSTAIILASVAVMDWCVDESSVLGQSIRGALGVAALLSLSLGALRVPAWILLGMLDALQIIVWLFAFQLWIAGAETQTPRHQSRGVGRLPDSH